MGRLCIRVLLVVIGSALVLFAVFPVLAFVHFDDSLQTVLMASKLLFLPIGALCLGAATMVKTGKVRR